MTMWLLAMALLGGGQAQGAAPAPQPAAAPATAIEAEARAFMADYARELIAGDRAAAVARYHRDGAVIVDASGATPTSHAAIGAFYNGPNWSALPRFQWHDLSYLPAGPDAVVTAGRFSLQPPSAAAPIFFSYSALLLRQDGQLRIRMEHEARAPAPPPPR